MLTLLRSLFKSTPRLYIEYALVGLLVSLAAVSLTLYIQRTSLRGQVSTLQERVSNLEGVSAVQDSVIHVLARQRVADARAVQGLSDDVKSLEVQDRAVHSKLFHLEQNDAAVRSYLVDSLPAGVRCLLGGTCPSGNAPGSDSTGASGTAHSALYPPGTSRSRDER